MKTIRVKFTTFLILTFLFCPHVFAIDSSPVRDSALGLSTFNHTILDYDVMATVSNFPIYEADFTVEVFVYFPENVGAMDLFVKDDLCHLGFRVN